MNNHILTIDIGGSSIKATVLNEQGEMLIDYQKKATPDKPDPSNVLKTIKLLVADFPDYSKISIGFPGYVRDGVIFTAPNLGNKQWKGCEFAQIIANQFAVPVRLLNDADLQGFGLIDGNGLELILTLGTGMGTALFVDGMLMPHLELSHFKIRTNKHYDAFIGNAAFEKDGQQKWNKKIKEVIKNFNMVVNYNKLYLSGGNSKKIDLKLSDNVKICGNRDGIKGGAFLWKKSDNFSLKTIYPIKNK